MLLFKYLLMARSAGWFSAAVGVLVADVATAMDGKFLFANDVLKTTPLGAFGVPHPNQH